jgi:hypothetical protein
VTAGEALTLPGRFGAHFEDGFLLRPMLVRLHNRAKLALGTTPTPKLVLGEDGWIFFAGERLFEGHLGRDPLSPEALAVWRSSLEANHAWLTGQGMSYQVVVVPNKASIYPERLPPPLRRGTPRSRLDQWLDHMAGSRVRVLDLRDALEAAKGDGHLYYPLGTHWTYRGAHVGYVATLDALGRADLTPTSWGELPLELGRVESWGQQLSLEDVLTGPDERRPAALPPEAARGHGREGPRVLVFGDSFTDAWGALLPRDAAAVRFADWTFSRGEVERFKPDVVIQQTLERNLIRDPRAGAERSAR